MATMRTVQKIKKRKIFEEVAEVLSEMIENGEYATGSRLPSERELSEMFGVGRSAIREALFALSKTGLLLIRSGEKAMVVEPDPNAVLSELSLIVRRMLLSENGIRELQDVRNLLESSLARRAARHATDEWIEKLRQALEANRAARGKQNRFERTDLEFHEVIVLISGNSAMVSGHSALVTWLTEQRTTSARTSGAEDIAFRGHEAIFRAIADRDPDRAEAEMSRHLDEVCSMYWKAYEEGRR